MDCAPRKFSFQCQIANFPQLFLLSKNQQCLWTDDNILNGTSGEEKNTRKHLFLLLNKNKQYKAESWAEKSFSDTVNVLFIAQPCSYELISCWWVDQSIAAMCCKYMAIAEGPCQFSGLDSWRGRSEICGSTATASISAPVWLLCAIHRSQGRDPYCQREPSKRQTRVTRGSTSAGGLLSWLACGERWRPEQLQHLGVRVVFWTSEVCFHRSPLHLSFASINSSLHLLWNF